MRNQKVRAMEKINEYEKRIMEISEWVEGTQLDTDSGIIATVKHRDSAINDLRQYIEKVKEEMPDSNKMYLSEIIEKENPEFTGNDLILAPVGSGKSTLINLLKKDVVGEILQLVSNTTLKESVCPDNMEIREANGHRMFTTGNKKRFGNVPHDIHIMTYAEFGWRIQKNNDFADKMAMIFCDEIHSLPDYKKISSSEGGNEGLTHAIKYLFMKQSMPIFYFTATDEKLTELTWSIPGALKEVKTHDYREHKDIRKYVALSEYKINNIEQIRPHLVARVKSFTYYGYKGLAFSRTIAGQRDIEDILIEEGFKPLVLWSVNNIENKMDEEQLKAREYLINTGKIPSPYNFLVINSAMQEGWNLFDKGVKLAIMNTTNETEHIQALGRLRSDVDVLIYRTNDRSTIDTIDTAIVSRYMDTPLTSEQKDILCKELNVVDSNGRTSRWRAIKSLLETQGYKIKNSKITTVTGRVNVSVISR